MLMYWKYDDDDDDDDLARSLVTNGRADGARVRLSRCCSVHPSSSSSISSPSSSFLLDKWELLINWNCQQELIVNNKPATRCPRVCEPRAHARSGCQVSRSKVQEWFDSTSCFQFCRTHTLRLLPQIVGNIFANQCKIHPVILCWSNLFLIHMSMYSYLEGRKHASVGAVNKSTVYWRGSLSTFLKVDSHCLYFWPDSQHTVDIFNLRS